MPVVLLPSLERGQTVLALSQAVVPLGEMGLERAALAELSVTHGAPELAALVCELVLAQPALAHEALATHLAHKGHRGAVELRHVSRQHPLGHQHAAGRHGARGQLRRRRLLMMMEFLLGGGGGLLVEVRHLSPTKIYIL